MGASDLSKGAPQGELGMIFLTDAQVAELADLPELTVKLRQAFQTPAVIPARTQYEAPGSKLLVMPAWGEGPNLGLKVVTVADRARPHGGPNVNGIYLLLDRETGDVRAVLEAASLTALRTACVSALAASALAPPASRSMLMIGTGFLAPHLIRAHLQACRLERVYVWGRSAAKAKALVQEIIEPGVLVEAVDDIEDVIGQVDIVCAATASRLPLIRAAQPRLGAYLALIGSFTPEMREADVEIIGQSRVVVDIRDALEEAGELVDAARAGRLSKVETLGEVLGKPDKHTGSHCFTVFKSVGAALADLVMAEAIVAAAMRRSDGRFVIGL